MANSIPALFYHFQTRSIDRRRTALTSEAIGTRVVRGGSTPRWSGKKIGEGIGRSGGCLLRRPCSGAPATQPDCWTSWINHLRASLGSATRRESNRSPVTANATGRQLSAR